MATLTADQIAANWAARLAASGQRITDGVNATNVAPGQAAARQSAAWIAGVQASQQKWAARVAAVPLSEWQQSMITKGVPRVGAGAAAAQPKFSQFMTGLLPRIQAAKQSLPARGDINTNLQRANQFAMALHQAYSKGS